MRKFIFFILSIVSLCSLPVLSQDYTVEDQPALLENIIEIEGSGVLKIKENGFVYLDVSNDFIEQAKNLLQTHGKISYLPTSTRSLGAHISVFHQNENIIPDEIGKEFYFQIKEVHSFTNRNRDGLKKQWVITVESASLEALRESYGLSNQLQGNDFHITLGKQLPSAPEGWQDKQELSPFNFRSEKGLSLETEGDFVHIDASSVIATAEKVNNVAQLCLKNNGFVYLNVDDQFIDDVVYSLPLQGSFTPTATGERKMGAHISVMYEDELIGNEIWNFEEAGDWFAFTVKELRYVHRGSKRLWLLAVDCPALQLLREHYGLRPKLKGHDFHITLGYEDIVEFDLPMAA